MDLILLKLLQLSRKLIQRVLANKCRSLNAIDGALLTRRALQMLNFVKRALEAVKLEDEFLIGGDGGIAQGGNDVADQLGHGEEVADRKSERHCRIASSEGMSWCTVWGVAGS